MEKTSMLRRNVAAFAGLGLIATPLVALGSPAFASDADCTAVDPGATEVLPDICEIQYVETGDFTLTPPSGVTKLTALIVGGGGATFYADGTYAGGGGAVVYVANVDASTTVNITVGIGAQSSSDAQGGSSSVNSDIAEGGYTGHFINGGNSYGAGGDSGNGNAGSSYSNGDLGSGGGAGGAAGEYAGGLGVLASEAANDATMWPADPSEPYYGAGGSIMSMAPGYGDAGWGADGSGDRDYGMDGLVILRWTTKAAELPATGFNAGAFAAFAAAFMIPGAALLAFASRGRRTQAQR